jgi:hypothetical protein
VVVKVSVHCWVSWNLVSIFCGIFEIAGSLSQRAVYGLVNGWGLMVHLDNRLVH